MTAFKPYFVFQVSDFNDEPMTFEVIGTQAITAPDPIQCTTQNDDNSIFYHSDCDSENDDDTVTIQINSTICTNQAIIASLVLKDNI